MATYRVYGTFTQDYVIDVEADDREEAMDTANSTNMDEWDTNSSSELMAYEAEHVDD